MSKDELIHKTTESIKLLDERSLQSVNDYVQLLALKIENRELPSSLTKLAEKSKAFAFLNNEPELYSDNDLIEKFNENR